jgi:hypothetical protein
VNLELCAPYVGCDLNKANVLGVKNGSSLKQYSQRKNKEF